MPPAPKNPSLSWVVKPLIAEELYTDREEFLEYFHTSARAAAGRRTLSTVMLGHRRMGKTEIFKRVVNRLFFEQDPKSPDAVVPVYFSFPDGPMDPRQFGVRYLENFIRYYVGFQTRQPDLVAEKAEGENLLSRIRDSRALFPFSKRLDLLLDGYETVRSGRSVLPHQTALEIPRRISDIDDSTIAMFLDEFQNTRLPQYDFDITSAGLLPAEAFLNYPVFKIGKKCCPMPGAWMRGFFYRSSTDSCGQSSRTRFFYSHQMELQK